MTDPVPQGTVRAACVRAANPSPMTLSGTNTWLVVEPGADEVVVVDPGPELAAHRHRVLAQLAAAGQRVGAVLLTHAHPDHAAGLPEFLAATGAELVVPAPGGFRLCGVAFECLATPGHTSDSVSFVITADGALLTGDTVLGRGTSVVAHPDGRLGDYLNSLELLRDVARERGLRELLPGHGPQLSTDVAGVIDGYLAHRSERLAQVRSALAAGARTPAEGVAVVYADVDRSLWPAALLSVAAQLEFLGA